MSESEKKTESNLKEWMTTTGAILAVVAGLAAIVKTLVTPEDSRSIAIAGFAVYLLITLWFAFVRFKGKAPWRWASLLLLYVVTVPYCIWVGTWDTTPRLPPSASSPDGNLVKYLDLGKSAEGWEDLIRYDAGWANPQTTRGAAVLASQDERGAGYDLRLDAGGWLNYVIKYAYPVQADVIIAHFYLPDTHDIEADWIGVQAIDEKSGLLLARSANPVPLGQWTQMVLDLRGKYGPDDVQLSDRPVHIEVFYAVKGAASLNAGTVRARLAGIAWYKDVGHEVGARLEQRGAGRLLFDFEDERVGDWQVAAGRVPTDTIKFSSEQAHRGNGSLKWETQLVSGDHKSYIKTLWHGSAPQGGWIASVYLPNDDPAGTSVWANFYTYSKADWQDSPPVFLTRGMWNTLVWDTHSVDWGTTGDVTIGIQIGAEGGPYKGPLYVDDIQVFEK